jgi:branched-chain amino acid transport system permease protein
MPAYALSDYLQFIASGISTGSIYVLIALGQIDDPGHIVDRDQAQGEFVMLGAMLAVMFNGLGLPLLASAALSVVCAMAIGALVQRATIHPARRASEVSLIMITIGASIVIRGLALAVWGTTPYSLPDFTAGGPLNILGAVVSRQRLWIMGTALVVLIALFAYFEFTLSGKALRACAINRYTAELMGINTELMALGVYAVGAGMSAIAGIVIAPLTLVTYDMGLSLGLKGFVVAIMGGMVSAPAAVIGGLLLGVIESLTAGLLSSGLKDAVAFLVLFGVLVARTLGVADLFRRRA